MLSENIIDLHYVSLINITAVAFYMYINAILVLRQSTRIQDGYKCINNVHRQLSNQSSISHVSAVEPYVVNTISTQS